MISLLPFNILGFFMKLKVCYQVNYNYCGWSQCVHQLVQQVVNHFQMNLKTLVQYNISSSTYIQYILNPVHFIFHSGNSDSVDQFIKHATLKKITHLFFRFSQLTNLVFSSKYAIMTLWLVAI